MEAAQLPRTPSLPDAVRAVLLAALLALAAIAWIATDLRMGGMDAGPGTELGSFGFFIAVWVVMMAAMMFPSVAPMVFMYTRVQSGKKARGAAVTSGGTALLLSGYLLSWSAAGAAAYGIFELVESLSIGFLAWGEGGPYVAGAVILAAAIYQLTPLKEVCLRHCRNPFQYLTQHWRPGAAGALRMGIDHGAWCVGCCWMLMAALFALGVMSLGWMAVVAAMIAAEKMLPWKAVANRGIAILLVAIGLGVAFAPDEVPGLTIPGSPEAVEAMEAMGMELEPAMPAGQTMPEMSGEDKAMPGMSGEGKAMPGMSGEGKAMPPSER